MDISKEEVMKNYLWCEKYQAYYHKDELPITILKKLLKNNKIKHNK